MTRKKAQAAAARKPQDEIHPHAKPEKPKRPVSPPFPAAEDQICHLKALNGLLLKETMERREQVSHLNSLVGDLSDDHSFRSSLESEVLSLLLSSLLSDERAKAEEMARSSQAVAESALKEKERIKKKLEAALMDRDLKKNQAEQLEAKLQEQEVKAEEVVRRKEEEVELLIVQKKADADKRLALEEEIRRFKLAKEGLEGELGQAKEELFLLKKDKDLLSAKVVDLDERNEKMLEELNRFRVRSDALKNEKEEGERMYQEKLRESSQKLDMVEAELLEQIEDIMLQNDEVRQERAKQDVHIAELQKNIGEYQAGEVELKRAINDEKVINTQLKAERDAAEIYIEELREEVEACRLSLVEVEKTVASVGQERVRLTLELSQLQKSKEEGEKSFDLQLRNSVEQIDDLMRKLGVVEAEKDRTEQARVELELQITRLRKESDHLGSIVAELKTVCVDHTTSISQLQTDRDATQRDLDSEREVVERLKLQLSELEKGKEEMLAKLGLLKAERDGLIIEHEENLERITAEKASLQGSLTAACDEIKGAAAKMKAAEMSSEKSLSLVRSISSAIHGMQEGNENGITLKIEDDAEVGEGMQHFAAELESIRKAFVCKASKVADLNNEVKLLQGAVADAHNKKGSFWTQFAPALSVLSIAAAIAAAYAAAKVR